MVLIIDPQIAGISGDMILSSLVNHGANKSKIIEGIYTAESFLDKHLDLCRQIFRPLLID